VIPPTSKRLDAQRYDKEIPAHYEATISTKAIENAQAMIIAKMILAK
jgi:hypothetical protein